MKKLLLLAGITCLAFVACKKNEGGSNPVKSRSDTLTAGKWQLTNMTLGTKSLVTGNDTNYNIYSYVDTCAQDDLYQFETNHNVMIDQNAKKCDASAPQQSESGTWALNNTNDTLVLDGVIPVGKNFKIVAFSNSSMQLQRDSTIGGLLPAKVVATFSHQ